MKPRIVLSGVNFIEGGPLAVFQDALGALAEHFLDRFEVIALVHRRDLFQVPGITYEEFSVVKGSWLRRLKFEYWDCRGLSRELKPTIWLAMHDITPNVSASVQAVYCHNPAPFYRLGLAEAKLDPTFALFRLFYRFLYAINIRKNDFVIVQQDWLRAEFRRRFRPKQVIVAHPSIPPTESVLESLAKEQSDSYIFFYPAFPRSFKNFELILQAAALLEKQDARSFEVWLTIDGSENSYAAKLRGDFGHLKTVRWLGTQSRDKVEEMYQQANCLIFPSKLETWGMPISEWKRTGKPMLVANLPYAHESVGDYGNVAFVDVYDPAELSGRMQSLVNAQDALGEAHAETIAAPFAENWRELFEILLASASEAYR